MAIFYYTQKMISVEKTTTGFTIVELVVVILVIAILASVAIPRFLDADDESRIASAQITTGAFETAVTSLHGQWLAEAKSTTVTVDGITIDLTTAGWPTSLAGGTAGCIEIWNEVLKDPEEVVVYVANATPDEWSVLGAPGFCLYVHQYGKAYTASNLQPFFVYQLVGSEFQIRRFNMNG